MVYDSLKSLLKEYPYFLDKSMDSNFTKTRIVWNNRLKDLNDDLFLVYLAGKITKHILIWKEQNVEYDYKINFAVSLPNLKKVTCYKNDEIIYMKEYSFEDEVDKFNYIHIDTTQTDEVLDESSNNEDDDEDIEPIHYDPPIIPEDKFWIDVETYAEYHLQKGFPENDTIQGNLYDHDTSLDLIGELYNLPRKKYYTAFERKTRVPKDDKSSETVEVIVTEEVDYRYTEPAYNNCLSEDDYHYMNRILYYSEHIHDTPLPVLELWKLFGDKINTTMINREDLLCKMYDPKKHLLPNGEIDENWKPHRWEHKDAMCEGEKDEVFFFASVNNSQPLMGRKIKFTFRFFNSLLEENYEYNYIKPFIVDNETGDLIDIGELLNYSEHPESVKEWILLVNDFYDKYGLSEDIYDIRLVFYAYMNTDDVRDNTNYIESDELNILIKGCHNADWYVDYTNGSDNNIGDKEHPFKTIGKAIKKVEADHNVIVLKSGRHIINSTLNINKNTSVISCTESLVVNTNSCDMFSVNNDTFFDIQNVGLKYSCCEMFATDEEFINNSKKNKPFVLEIPLSVCKIPLSINVDVRKPKIYAHTNYMIKGEVLTKELIGRRKYIVGKVIDEHETEFDMKNGDIKHLNEPNLPVDNENIKLYYNKQLVDNINTDVNGKYNFNLKFRKSGEYNYILKHDESDNYCTGENNVLFDVEDMPTFLNAVMGKDKIFVHEELPLTFYVEDYYGNDVEEGEFKLYDGNNLVATIGYDETDFHYVPSVGEHTFKLNFSGTGYVTSVVDNLKIVVVKHDTSMSLLADKSYYIVGDETIFTGLLFDDYLNSLDNANVSLYIDDKYIGWKTTSDGEVTFNRVLTEGTHLAYLKYNGDDTYNPCTSNVFRVKVRSDALQDINLHLYPQYKIFDNDGTSVNCKVYACDSNGNPLKTSFRIWNSYDIIYDSSKDCEMYISDDTVYTTGNDGWVTFNLSLPMLAECHGVLIQAISTLDMDIYSEVVFIRQYIDSPLEVDDYEFDVQVKYSYADEDISFKGYISDEEENRIPNEYVHLELYDGDTLLNFMEVMTDYAGEFNSTIRNQGVRLDNLKLKISHGVDSKYGWFEDERTIVFYPPKTNITKINDLTFYADEDKFSLRANVIDEFNKLVVDGRITLTIGDNKYYGLIAGGEYIFNDVTVPDVGSYNCKLEYDSEGYYQDSETTFKINVLKLDTGLTVNMPSSVTYSDEFEITGVLNNVTRGTFVTNEYVDLYVDNVEVGSYITDNKGVYKLKYTVSDSTGVHKFQVKYAGNDIYKASNSVVCNINVNKETSILQMDEIPSVLFNNDLIHEDLVVSGFLLTDDGEVIKEDVKIKIMKGSSVVDSAVIRVGDDGGFEYVKSNLAIGEYNLVVKHDESDNYSETLFEAPFKVIEDEGDIELYLDTENDTSTIHVGEVFLITVINEYFGEAVFTDGFFDNAELYIYNSNGNLVDVPVETNIWNDALIYTVQYGATTGLSAGEYRIKVVIPRTATHMEHSKELNIRIVN